MKLATLAALAAGFALFAPLGAPAHAVVAPTGVIEPAAPATDVVEAPAPAADAAAPLDAPASTYVPMAPTKDKGMPTDPRTGEPGAMMKSLTFQDQYSDNGDYALWMHNVILMPVITFISLLVLGLILWVVVRFNRKSNPVASKTTHNTMIEVVWTIVPVIILVVIAVPSITLLARQYETPPADAVTIKVTGHQWNWEYTYPDHGEINFVSNMLKEKSEVKDGERFRTENDGPGQLAVDNRMVVPVGVPLRIQTTASTVIHAFAVPSLWFKMDAVPGRLNEKLLTIKEPGVYYGQCSELCGALHGFMPIAVEALPPAEFAAWVKSQGGTMPGEAAAPAAAPAGEAAPATEEVARSLTQFERITLESI